MQSRIWFTYYTLHGTTIIVASDHKELSDALNARLRPFASAKHGVCDIVFEFRGVPSPGDHVVAKPSGWMRIIDGVTPGEVSYSDGQDKLFVTYADRLRILCDFGQDRALISFLSSDPESVFLASHALFTIVLVELLKRRRRLSVQAAGFCLAGKGLLIPGTTGAGKSTLAIALLRAGFSFLGDDVILLEQSQNGPRMLALSDEIDLDDTTVQLFPELHLLLEQPKTPGSQKRQLWSTESYGAGLIAACHPAAIVFPRVAHTQRSVITPLNPEEALRELTPNVLLTEPLSSQVHMEALAELANQCACYRLEMGHDFADLPGLVRRLMA